MTARRQNKAGTPENKKRPARRRLDLDRLDCGCPMPQNTQEWLDDEKAPCLCCWRCPRHARAGHVLSELNDKEKLLGIHYLAAPKGAA